MTFDPREPHAPRMRTISPPQSPIVVFLSRPSLISKKGEGGGRGGGGEKASARRAGVKGGSTTQVSSIQAREPHSPFLPPLPPLQRHFRVRIFIMHYQRCGLQLFVLIPPSRDRRCRQQMRWRFKGREGGRGGFRQVDHGRILLAGISMASKFGFMVITSTVVGSDSGSM